MPGFRNNFPVGHDDNMAAIEWIKDWNEVRLTARLKNLYGMRLCHELTLSRARLLIFLGQYDAASNMLVELEEGARSGKACGTEPKVVVDDEEGKTGRTDASAATQAAEVEESEAKPPPPRRLIQLEVYLICNCLILQARIAEKQRNFGQAIVLAEKAALFHAEQTRLREEIKQRAALLEAQRARHAKQAMGMSPRAGGAPLGGIAEESENDILDDLLAADFRASEDEDPLLHPGMVFWLTCRTIVCRCRLAKGHYEEARQSCDKGIEEGSLSMENLRKRELMIMRAQIHMSEGEVAEAQKLYEGALEKGREHHDLDEDHAEAAMLLGDLRVELALAEPADVGRKSKQAAGALYEEALDCLTLKLRNAGWRGSTADKESVLHNIYLDRWLNRYTKALLRLARIKAEESGAAKDTEDSGDESTPGLLDGLKCIEEGLRSLDHQSAPNITLDSQLSLFEGRYQRVLLPLSTDVNTVFPMVVQSLERSLESTLKCGHNHTTLRAAHMELVELYGRQWISGEEENHKNQASKHLKNAADVASMYASLKGDVGSMCSSTPYTEAKLDALPPAARLHLRQEGLRRLKKMAVAETEEVDADESEPEVPIDQRGMFLYYLSLVQTRRLADATLANDLKAETIREMHDFLRLDMVEYAEKCCVVDATVENEDGSEPAVVDMPLFSVCAQWYLASKEDGENVACLYSLLGGIEAPDEDAAPDESEETRANQGDLGRCVLPVEFIRATSKRFAGLRIKKASSIEIESTLRETTAALADAAMKAGMRDGNVRMETDPIVMQNMGNDALLLIEKMFDLDIGVNCVHEGVSRWLRNALLG
jgi:tetratricopeptide (TPR) repeat protein